MLYCAERRPRDALIGADTVDLTGEHQGLVVGRIAGQKEADVTVLSQNGDMTGRVSRCGDGDNGAVRGEAGARHERSGVSILPEAAVLAAHRVFNRKDGFPSISNTEIALVAAPNASPATRRLAEILCEFCTMNKAKRTGRPNR